MSARRNPALMALVADLAQLGEADVRAILDELDPSARAQLVSLIDGYRQGDLAEAPVPSASPVAPAALSGWLTDRLAVNDETRSTGMTPHASETLRRIAQEHGWIGSAPQEAPSEPRRPLLSRLGLGA